MAETRAQLLERAKLIQQAREIQAQRAAAKTPEAPSNPADDLSAAAQGLGSGVTLGYAPQINAAVEPVTNALAEASTGDLLDIPSNLAKGWSESGDYVDRRDRYTKMQDELKARHPLSYGAGNIAGTVAGALALPSAALPKAGLALKTLASMGTGGAMRAAQNPGDVQGEVNPIQLEERTQAVMDPLGLGVDAILPGAGAGMKRVAETRAFKALGPYAANTLQKGMDKAKIREIGRDVLDSGAFGWIPKSYESLRTGLQGLKNKAGDRLSKSVEDMAAKEAQLASGDKVGLSRSEMSNNIRSEVLSPEIDAAGVQARNAKMEGYLDTFNRGNLPENVAGPVPDKLGLLEAELKKRNVGKEINWDRQRGADIPDSEVFNRKLYSELQQGVEDGGEKLAEKVGFDVNDFKKQKSTYGNLKKAEAIADKRDMKEFANRLASPSDYGVGLVGAGYGFSQGDTIEDRVKNAAMGGSLGLMNKGARLYGNQMTARMLDRGAKILSNPLPAQAVWSMLYRNKQQEKKK